MIKFRMLVAIGLTSLVSSGCLPLSPRAIDASRIYDAPELVDDEPQIQRGEPRPIVDGIGWVVGIPNKLLLWDRRVDSHRVSFETEAAVAEYLRWNDLPNVRVRLNQYRPGQDWQRLVRNKRVAAPWRYTLGTLSVLGETLLPGRIVGGDHYNPFTNTVHIYSDVPAIALHEAGHAKDFARRKWKGTYAAAYLLPIVPLYHESLASGDVVAYLEAHGDVTQRMEAARILHPAYATYVGSAAGSLLPDYSNPLYLVAVLAGHSTGRWQAHRLASENASTTTAVTDEGVLPEH